MIFRAMTARAARVTGRAARCSVHTVGAVMTVVGLLGAFLPVPVLAQGVPGAQGVAQTWEVQAGGTDSGTPAFGGDPSAPAPSVIAQSFLPNPLVVRAGDTVKWTFADLHTITFLGGKPDPAVVLPGPGEGEATFGPAFFPIGTTTGRATYDGSTLVSSGAPLMPEQMQAGFQLTFSKPGLFGYVCLIHPGMRGEIQVQEAGAPLPETPAQAKARGQATLSALLNRAKSAAQTAQATTFGDTHIAFAGKSDPFGASAVQFLPGNVSVRRGDTVVWILDPFEEHTITFLSGTQAPDVIVPHPQASGAPLLVLPANVVGPVGGNRYTGQGYVNSGFLGAMGGNTAITFDAPPGTYAYFCLLHPYMKGTITVTG
jgi:plastocyanin